MNRILIVEDDSYLRIGLGAALKQEGFEVSFATNGKEGFDAAKNLIPSLIICDVMMPLLNGLQLKQKLNQDEKLAHIPLLFLSVRDKEEDIQYALSLRAEGYLVKPVKFPELLNKIKTVLRLHRKANE